MNGKVSIAIIVFVASTIIFATILNYYLWLPHLVKTQDSIQELSKDVNSSIQELCEDIKRLSKDIQGLTKDIQGLSEEINSTKQTIADLNEAVTRLTEEINELKDVSQILLELIKRL